MAQCWTISISITKFAGTCQIFAIGPNLYFDPGFWSSLLAWVLDLVFDQDLGPGSWPMTLAQVLGLYYWPRLLTQSFGPCSYPRLVTHFIGEGPRFLVQFLGLGCWPRILDQVIGPDFCPGYWPGFPLAHVLTRIIGQEKCPEVFRTAWRCLAFPVLRCRRLSF